MELLEDLKYKIIGIINNKKYTVLCEEIESKISVKIYYCGASIEVYNNPEKALLMNKRISILKSEVNSMINTLHSPL